MARGNAWVVVAALVAGLAAAPAAHAVTDPPSSGTVTSSIAETARLRHDARVPKRHPPRITATVAQSVRPAIAAPGAAVTLTTTTTLAQPAIAYTDRGPICGRRRATGYTVVLGPTTPDQAVLLAIPGSPAAVAPFAKTYGGVPTSRESEERTHARIRGCRSVRTIRTTVTFPAPSVPGSYTATLGPAAITQVRRRHPKTRIPARALDLEVRGRLPVLQVV